VSKAGVVVRLANLGAVLGSIAGSACAQSTRVAIEAQYQRLATAFGRRMWKVFLLSRRRTIRHATLAARRSITPRWQTTRGD